MTQPMPYDWECARPEIARAAAALERATDAANVRASIVRRSVRRRYGHNLFFYLLFLLGILAFAPLAALVGIGMCAGGVVAAGAVAKARHADVGPVFTPQPVPDQAPAGLGSQHSTFQSR